MKLVIESGITFDEAVEQLKMFFYEKCADYPYLKSKMNIYVDLKNDKKQICPENEKEFEISGGEIVDVLAREEYDTLLEMIEKLKSKLQWLKYQREDKKRDIERDKKYLDTAEEKGRKQERIKNRKVELQEHLEQYDNLQNKIHEYECILNEIKTGRVECKVDVRTEKRYGRNKRVYEMSLFGQCEEFQWRYSNLYGLII